MLGKYISVDTKGNNYLVVYYDENGVKRFKIDENYSPSLYIGNDNESLLLPMEGLTKRNFRNWWSLMSFARESPLRCFGAPNAEVDYIVSNFGDDKVELNFRKEDYNIVYFDIETKTENGFPDTRIVGEEITLLVFIAPYIKKGKDSFVFTTFNYTGDKLTGDNIDLHQFNDEHEMLKQVVLFLEQLSPDFLCGHNSEVFDIPYIVGRVEKLLGKSWAERLSPFRHITKDYRNIFDEELPIYNITGIPSIDFLVISKKFINGDRPSWGLDSIAEDYLEEKKIQNPGSNFKEFYEGTYDIKEKPNSDDHIALHLAHKRYLLKRKGINTHDKEAQRKYKALDVETKKQAINLFVEYGFRDVELLVRLADATGFIDLAGTIMYMMKSNMRDVAGTIRLWENRLYSFLHSQQRVPFIKTFKTPQQKYPGGFVKDTIKGLFDWIETVDYESLYPSLIRCFNISPETYVGNSGISQGLTGFNLIKQEEDLSFLKNGDVEFCMGANGALFRKDIRGFIPEIVSIIFSRRKEIKGNMLTEAKQLEKRKQAFEGFDFNKYSLTDIERELDRRGVKYDR